MIPLRLGLVNINPIYIDGLKVCCTFHFAYILVLFERISVDILGVPSDAAVNRTHRRKAESSTLLYRIHWYSYKMSSACSVLLLTNVLLLGDDVVFLDPHLTQNTIDFDEEEFDDSTYHTETCARINFQSMDPSLAVVILVQSF